MKSMPIILIKATALAGIGVALAFKAHYRPADNTVYAAEDSGPRYVYSNTAPRGLICQPLGPACTITSTATAGYFNTNNANTFPPESNTPGAPIVHYHNVGKIYQ